MPDELRIFLLVPLGFGVIGVLFAWWGVRRMRSVSAFKRMAARAPGVCIGLDRQRFRGGGIDATPSTIFYPVVRFALPDGRQVETRTESGASPPPAREGAAVTVLYDPARPERARVEGVLGDGTIPYTMFIVLGSVFAVVGLGVFAIAVALTV